LQQSIQSQSQKLAQVTRSAGGPPWRAGVAVGSCVRCGTAGDGLLSPKKYDDALTKFQTAVALKPGDAVLVNNLGYLYHVMGRYDEALSTWRRR